MKKVKRYLAVLCFLAGCAAVQAARADTASGSLDKGFWIKAYTGYDNAVLGDLNSGLKAWGDFGASGGLSTLQNSDTSGYVAGGEFGFQLDPDDALSVGCENVWGTTLSDTGTQAGAKVYTISYTPSLLGVTLNYYRAIIRSDSAKTLLFIGGGYYAAAGTFSTYIPADPSSANSGTFNGGTLGGVLGASEEISIGGAFSFMISAKGRLATISKMVSTNITNGNGTLLPGNYDLVVTNYPFTGYNVLFGQSESSPYSAGTTRLAAQDESGFQGDIGVVAHF